MLYHSELNWNANIDDGGMADSTEFIHAEGTAQANRYEISGEGARPSIGLHVMHWGVWKDDPGSALMLDNMSRVVE